MELNWNSLHTILQDIDGVLNSSRILLAVSGGIDSMVMLSLFYELAYHSDISIAAGHINHNIRKNAAVDAQFVESVCQELEIAVVIRKVDVPSAMRDSNKSMEMAARDLRYAALDQIRDELDCDFIATAHTASDQAETVMMRVISGTGSYGLQGIREKHGKIIRPLIDFSRVRIEQYAEKRHIEYREDTSNYDTAIERNWIRHKLLPLIAENLNPKIEEALCRLTVIQGEIEDLLEYEADKALKSLIVERSNGQIVLEIHKLCTYFTAIQKAIIYKCLELLGGNEKRSNFQRIQQFIKLIQGKPSGSEIQLSGSVKALIDRNLLLITSVDIYKKYSFPFKETGTLVIGDFQLRSEYQDFVTPGELKSSNESYGYFDAEVLKQLDLTWRNWNIGDVIQLANSKRKKLSDVWIDQKIPVWEKYSIPLLAAGKQILWIPEIKRSGTAWVSEDTKEIIKLTAKRIAKT